MVSKITKKTLAKSFKHSPNPRHHSRQAKLTPSPLKSLASAATSFNRSLRTCRRRLIKVFSSLAVFHTPTKQKKGGFRRLTPSRNETEVLKHSLRLPPNILPPPSAPGRKTVFLDLDETLVHSCTGIPPEQYHFTIHPTINGQATTFYVLKRPDAEALLRAAAESYEVIIFTAGIKEYASLVLDRLDPDGKMIAHRLYRDSCRKVEDNKLVKDLSCLSRDLEKVVIVDDNPASYALQKENAFPISPFIGDLGDRELQEVIKFLNLAACFEDMREAVAFYLSTDWRGRLVNQE